MIVMKKEEVSSHKQTRPINNGQSGRSVRTVWANVVVVVHRAHVKSSERSRRTVSTLQHAGMLSWVWGVEECGWRVEGGRREGGWWRVVVVVVMVRGERLLLLPVPSDCLGVGRK